MSDSLITIIAIFLAAVLMFGFPLIAISEMNDTEAQAMIQSYTVEYVNTVLSKGKITKDDYDAFIQKLAATGNYYEVEYNVQVADGNPGKKEQNGEMGDTTYYGIYTTQVEEYLNKNGVYLLKEGDYITVYVKNTNTTISQMIKSALYGITGNQSYVIYAEASGTSTVTGQN